MLSAAAVLGGVETFDFTAGGLIPAANCLQAFDPYIVQDLAQSYVDLSPNGNNAIATVPPTLGVAGWVFNGTTQYVDTGLKPTVPSYSAFMQYTGLSGLSSIFGLLDTTAGPQSYVYGSADLANFYATNASGAGFAKNNGPVLVAGNYGFAGVTPYRNGAAEANTITPSADVTPVINVWIGTMNLDNALYLPAPITVSRWAMYDIVLNAAQVAALAAVMAV